MSDSERESRLVPLVEAAARLKVSRWTLRRWLSRVPGAGRFLGGRWFVVESEISTVRDLARESGKASGCRSFREGAPLVGLGHDFDLRRDAVQ